MKSKRKIQPARAKMSCDGDMDMGMAKKKAPKATFSPKMNKKKKGGK